nr:PREDICTED: uncharacterized protein LOC107077994 isoform X5 [Lepisosteus oculatus]
MTRNAISLTLFVLFPLANYKHHDTVWAEETGYCSPPAPLSDTEHPNLARRFNEGAVFRYNCTVGYVRKAGTSNLIRCVKKNNTLVWSQSNLICITDPKLKRTKTSEISVSSVTGAVAGGTTFTVIILASAVMFYVWRIYRHPRSRTPIMPSELQPISKPLNNKDVTLNVPENEDEE